VNAVAAETIVFGRPPLASWRVPVPAPVSTT
jgi:hypothetical protein